MANITTLNPIDQIKKQNMLVRIETDETRFFECEKNLFEDETISVNVKLEITLDYHPDYGRTARRLVVEYLSAYDSEECEYLDLNILQIRELEYYLTNNLIININ